jgi:alkylation response protein AidB-like acyl-CoA dehydrogenase
MFYQISYHAPGYGWCAVATRGVLLAEPTIEYEDAIVDVVRRFVERDVKPVAREYEREDRYPQQLIEQMKQLGVFGLSVPEPYGHSKVSARCYARVTEELARGWMSLSGAMGGHSVVSHLVAIFGTPAQRERYLPRFATGEWRATMALTEPSGGSDLQAITTAARRTGERYVVRGSKTWITNAEHSEVICLMCKTDPDAEPPHRGISLLLVEKGEGFEVSRSLPKLGYRGVESCELTFDDYEVPVDALLGGTEGRGFPQMMKGLELGRIQVAARAIGVAQAAFDDAVAYAQVRQTFGVPIWQHQSIGNYLADAATNIAAARGLVRAAAERFDKGARCDLEAGMAKLFASEMAMKVTLDAMRIHGSYGYSTEFDIERYFRDAPLMIIGEGTNEIQRNVIVRELIRRSSGQTKERA